MDTTFEIKPTQPFEPTAVVIECAENGADCLLFDAHSLPPAFFDLSSGLAGELLHRLSIYQMRMAAVVPDLEAHSAHFQAFAREANRGDQFRFFSTRQQAVQWIESS